MLWGKYITSLMFTIKLNNVIQLVSNIKNEYNTLYHMRIFGVVLGDEDVNEKTRKHIGKI